MSSLLVSHARPKNFNCSSNQTKCKLMANIILYLTVALLTTEASVSHLLWNIMVIEYWPSHIITRIHTEMSALQCYWFDWLRKSYWNVIKAILSITPCVCVIRWLSDWKLSGKHDYGTLFNFKFAFMLAFGQWWIFQIWTLTIFDMVIARFTLYYILLRIILPHTAYIIPDSISIE